MIEGSLTLLGVTEAGATSTVKRFKCNPASGTGRERCGGNADRQDQAFGFRDEDRASRNLGDEVTLTDRIRGDSRTDAPVRRGEKPGRGPVFPARRASDVCATSRARPTNDRTPDEQHLDGERRQHEPHQPLEREHRAFAEPALQPVGAAPARRSSRPSPRVSASEPAADLAPDRATPSASPWRAPDGPAIDGIASGTRKGSAPGRIAEDSLGTRKHHPDRDQEQDDPAGDRSAIPRTGAAIAGTCGRPA